MLSVGIPKGQDLAAGFQIHLKDCIWNIYYQMGPMVSELLSRYKVKVMH